MDLKNSPCELASLVDPLHGTVAGHPSSEHGLGKTIPGPTTPFGMVQPGPDTVTGGDNASGYCWTHQTIEGFSLLHMSGTGWYGDLGNLLVTPCRGPLRTHKGHCGGGDGYRSKFCKETESAKLGYYAVTLDDPAVRVEMTAAPHSAALRFEFAPDVRAPRLQFDLARRVAGTSVRQSVTRVDKRSFEGWMRCHPDGGGWGDGRGRAEYTVYFFLRLKREPASHGIWSAAIPPDANRRNQDVASVPYQDRIKAAEVVTGVETAEGSHLGFYVEYEPCGEAATTVGLQVGISFVDLEGARRNLEAEQPCWDFEGLRKRAEATWAETLSSITTEGGSPLQRKLFATCLYRACLDPRSVTDHDGRSVDHQGRIRPAGIGTQRTVFSGWDVFRSQFPLLTLIRPDVVAETINSLMRVSDEGGSRGLPRWEFMGRDTPIMLGDPALSVIADAWTKDLPGFDRNEAYAHMQRLVFGPQEVSNRKFWEAYTRLGYVPGSISHTLENCYGDFCAAVIASERGNPEMAEELFRRSRNYRKIFDPTLRWFRAKDEFGNWLEWNGRETQLAQGCVESNPWQQGWFVPHDPQGLIDLIGGKDAFLSALEEFFAATPEEMLWNDAYNHSNEPVHLVPFLFTAAGAPWLTQKWCRFILKHAYRDGPFGLVGNEDCGQLSAWFVLVALGLHPIAPGDPKWMITSPLFDRVVIRLPDVFSGRNFTIATVGNSDEVIYVQQAKLNGELLDRAWLHHHEITHGGLLELVMGIEPNKSWGAEGFRGSIRLMG